VYKTNILGKITILMMLLSVLAGVLALPVRSSPWQGSEPEQHSTTQTAGVGARKAELLARAADGMQAWRFNGTGWQSVAGGGPFTDAQGWDQPQYYETIHSGDIDGDGVDELLGRAIDGMSTYRFNGTGWDHVAGGGPFPDENDWDWPQYYATIHSADIDGDGVDELLARAADGMQAYRFNGTGWDQVAGGGPFPDEDDWDWPQYYATIHSGDIDGDGVDELLARAADGMQAYRFNGNDWELVAEGGPFTDAQGWGAEPYYATIHSGDIDGDGVDELLGRAIDGMSTYRFNGTGWDHVAGGGPFTDAEGWDAEQYYATIHSGDIDGRAVEWVVRLPLIANAFAGRCVPASEALRVLPPLGQDSKGRDLLDQSLLPYLTVQVDVGKADELLARAADGMQAWRFNGTGWQSVAGGGPFPDADGWDQPKYYETIHSGDIDGDGADELLGRGADGMQAYRFNGTGWDQVAGGGPFTDAQGWGADQE
jgi:hypothetical protein